MFQYLDHYRYSFHEFYPVLRQQLLESFLDTPFTEIPHVLLYGPPGNAKDELCYHFIQWLTDYFDVHMIKQDLQNHTLSNGAKVTISVRSTDCFIEYTPTEQMVYDKYVIADIIAPAVSQRNIAYPRHIIVINAVHDLTKNAMLCLRKIMEKYASQALFILKANSISRIDHAILSRCSLVRISSPTPDQLSCIVDRMSNVFHLELPPTVKDTLITKSGRNIDRLLIYMTTYDITQDVESVQPVFQKEIESFVSMLAKAKLPWTVIPKIREFVYKVMLFNIPHAKLFRDVIGVLLAKYPKKRGLLQRMTTLFAEIETELLEASKPSLMYESAFFELFTALHEHASHVNLTPIASAHQVVHDHVG